MRTISFTIKRYDGTKEWLQRYQLPYESGKTMLWALTKIKEEQDPTLNFTSACRHAICGSCAIRVNGNALGEVDNLGARHAYAFHDDVKSKGRLNEITLPMKTEGVVQTMKRIPFALRMISKGKINPLHLPKEIEGIKGVRKIYQFAKEITPQDMKSPLAAAHWTCFRL